VLPGPQHPLDERDVDGLGHVHVEAGGQRLEAISLLFVARHRDEQHRLSEHGLHPPRDVVAAHPAQTDVDDRDVGLFGDDHRQSFGPVVCCLHVVSEILENCAKTLTQVVVVLDEHDPARTFSHRRTTLGHRCGRLADGGAGRSHDDFCAEPDTIQDVDNFIHPLCATHPCRRSRPPARGRHRCP
jgi:hypothetical protein